MRNKEFLYFIAGLILLTIVSVDIYWWVSISSDYSKTFSEVQAEYHRKFPPFLRNGRLITVINIILLSISIFLFEKISSSEQFKKLGLIFMIICSVLVFWQIFTLM